MLIETSHGPSTKEDIIANDLPYWWNVIAHATKVYHDYLAKVGLLIVVNDEEEINKLCSGMVGTMEGMFV